LGVFAEATPGADKARRKRRSGQNSLSGSEKRILGTARGGEAEDAGCSSHLAPTIRPWDFFLRSFFFYCEQSRRLLVSLSKRIQDIVDFLGNQTFPLQQTNPVGVGIVDGRLLDMLKCKNFKNQPLTKHTQLVQSCIGIGIDIALRCRTDLCQRRPVSVEKFKVGFHVRPPNFSGASDNLVLSEVDSVNKRCHIHQQHLFT